MSESVFFANALEAVRLLAIENDRLRQNIERLAGHADRLEDALKNPTNWEKGLEAVNNYEDFKKGLSE